MMISQQGGLIDWRRPVAIIVVCATLSAGVARPTDSILVSLSGKVVGGSGKHVIFVALWDASGFLKRPVQQIRIEPRAEPHFQFQAPVGRWAPSAFEDENDNGILDMGTFGPKEPSGFWRPFHGWRKPHFDDVAAQIDRNTTDADIKLSR
jgi:Uncharacterized protein conserved in bacteria (DUF2141)